MKRKRKMHNEREFELDNIYDERQLDILDDLPFERLNK